MKFVRVTKDGEEPILLNTQYVKLIYRHYRDERSDIVEDEAGNRYECFDEIYCTPSFEASIVSFDEKDDTSWES